MTNPNTDDEEYQKLQTPYTSPDFLHRAYTSPDFLLRAPFDKPEFLRWASYDNPNLPRMSGHLSDALNQIGLTEEHRECRVKFNVMSQMRDTICSAIESSGKECHLRMGSLIEGTTAPGMDSDLDTLWFSSSVKAYCDKNKTKQALGLVFTHDETTPAGYTKLQPACQGCIINDASDINCRHDLNWPMNLKVDSKGRLMVAHFSVLLLGARKHGPADTIEGRLSAADNDIVRSFYCNGIANEMEEWCQRDRLHDWPSKATVDLFKTLGCFVVPVGHPLSPEKHMEWRMSFSLQERHLMWHLNPTQYHCFMLLKLIKTFLIKPLFGDVLTSYHCKTLLFYTIERHEQGIWTPLNLLFCLRRCLILLHEWISDRYIPNYFIPEENMFVKMHAALKDNYCNLKSLVAAMTDHWMLLFFITFNDFGKQLLAKINGKEIHVCITENSLCFARDCSYLKARFYSDCIGYMADIQSALDYLDVVAAVVQSSRTCTTYTTFDEHILDLYTQWFAGRSQTPDNSVRARRLIESQQFLVEVRERQPRLMAIMAWKAELLIWLGSVLAARYFQTGNKQYLLESETNLEEGKSLSPEASILIKATILLKQSLPDTSNAVFNEAEMISKDRIFWCECYDYSRKFIVAGVRKQKHRMLDRSLFRNTKYIFNLFGACCLSFKRCEFDILPEPLTFEAYRSFGTSIHSLSEFEHIWHDSVTVDPVMYLYYLQFLNNQHNKPGEAAVILLKFENELFARLVARHSSTLGHTETWLNVLGDIFVKKGWTRLALRCFKYSDKVRPLHNAVKWHVMFLLFSPSGGAI